MKCHKFKSPLNRGKIMFNLTPNEKTIITKNLAIFEKKSVGYHADIKIDTRLLLADRADELSFIYQSTDLQKIKNIIMECIANYAKNDFKPHYL